MSAVLNEIEWETVEENLGMLSDETLERFLKRILEIRQKRAVTPQVNEEAFE
jgi:hypothetical protein